MEKLVSSDYYLRCTLLFEKTPESLLEKIQFSTIIIHALKTLHGEVGAALRVDVIQYQPTPTISAILRTAKKNLVKLWSALTLLGCYDNRTCTFQITKISTSLMGLAVDSRQFEYNSTSTT